MTNSPARAPRGRKMVSRVGERFGRLEVVRQWRENGRTWVDCRCDCGNEARKSLAALVAGHCRSCGCLVPETRVSPITDRTGQRFGRLTVLEATTARASSGAVKWRCQCDCGNKVEVSGSNLHSGLTVSCGCQHAESMALRARHGMWKSPEYKCWAAMKQRCLNPNDRRWKDYGGRGIGVDPRWASDFRAFLADVGLRPSPGMSLDRIDNDGNYEPGNVRWADRSTQMRNRRRRQAAR